MDFASLHSHICVEHGCARAATFWSSALSTRMPTLCDTHAEEMRQQFSLPPAARLVDIEREDADDLRARLRLAENVCYYAQRLLKEPTTNLDVNIPALRTAVREWVRGAKA